MAKLWFSSDLHLFHENIFKLFKVNCAECKGSGVYDVIDSFAIPCPVCGGTGEIAARPFSSIAQMHSTMIDCHNALVKPEDHWWNLGDVTMLRGGKQQQELMISEVVKFNGHKRLVLGNHDQLPMTAYTAAGFDKIKGSHRIDNLLFSHFPLHPSTIAKGCVNVHGHIHTNPAPAGPYINISVEAINYSPVSLEWLQDTAQGLLR